MNRRILVNLTVFLVVSVVMLYWAVQNVVRFDLFTQPYPVNAQFVSSPGLHPDFEVDYLGVQVGRIKSVQLRTGRVDVVMSIDKGVKLPAGLTASAARKSAVGEPYIALSPLPGAVGGPVLQAGATIPVEDTSIPPDYGKLFLAVNKALGAINPDDAKTLVHEIYLGWNGRSDSLRQIIQGGDQLTQTFANNSDMINGLTKDLAKITHALAADRGSLGQGIDNLAGVTHSLAQVKSQLTQLRDQGPDLISQVDTLLTNSSADFNCAISTLGDVVPGLATPRYLSDLTATFAGAPRLASALNDVLQKKDGNWVLSVIFEVTLKAKATAEYKYPLAQPAVSKVAACPDGHLPGATAQKTYKGADPSSVIPPQYRPTTAPTTAPATGARLAGNSGNAIGGMPLWLVYVPPVIALLVLIKVMAGTVPVLARRRKKN